MKIMKNRKKEKRLYRIIMWNVKFWWPDHLQETTRKKQKKNLSTQFTYGVCVCMCKIEIFISMFRFLFFLFFFFNGTNGLNDCVYCVWWIKMWKVSSFFFSSYHNIIMAIFIQHHHHHHLSCFLFSVFFFHHNRLYFQNSFIGFFYMMKQNDYIGG